VKRIELIEPHEHDGRVYPPTTEIVVNDADADWLIALKKAKPVTVSVAASKISDKENAA